MDNCDLAVGSEGFIQFLIFILRFADPVLYSLMYQHQHVTTSCFISGLGHAG